MIIGILLTVGSFGLAAYNLYTERIAGAASNEIMEEIARATKDMDTPSAEPLPVLSYESEHQMEMPLIDVDGKPYLAVLNIPVLELQLPVLNEWSYPNLRISPCRFYGSVARENLVIVAHNYDTHFGRLKTLKSGDEVQLLSMNHSCISYKVSNITVVNPFATADVVSGEWPLTLCTCTIGGRTRVIVRCDYADEK